MAICGKCGAKFRKGKNICPKCGAAVNVPEAAGPTNAEEQFDLGNNYYNGEGVPQDYEKAVYWYAKAAEQGYVYAQFNLAYFYEMGQGVPQDFEKAAYWYAKAAEQGHDGAQCTLGFFYEMGQGVPKDYEKAAYWFSKAAEQGHDMARKNLKILVETANWGTAEPTDAAGQPDSGDNEGQGVPQEYENDVNWLSEAAEQGNADAQFNLANCYGTGEGVPMDRDKAMYWYAKATEQGHVGAKTMLTALKAIGIMFE